MIVDKRYMLLLALIVAAAATGCVAGSHRFENVKYEFRTEADVPAFKLDEVQWEVYNDQTHDRAYFYNTKQNYTQWEDPREQAAEQSAAAAATAAQQPLTSGHTSEEAAAEREEVAGSYFQGGGEPPVAVSAGPVPEWVETWHVATASAVVVVSALFARSLFLVSWQQA
jgi:hypothetical protein